MEEQLARSKPKEYPSLHPVHCPVFADQPVCGGRRMEMGPSGFLLKSLVTTHLDIRSYSSHAPPQGIKTNSKYKYKVKHEGKDKDKCKKCEDTTTLHWIFLHMSCKLPFNQLKNCIKIFAVYQIMMQVP